MTPLLMTPERRAPVSFAELRVEHDAPRALVKAFVRSHHSLLPDPPAAWQHGFALMDGAGDVWGVAAWGLPVARLEDQRSTLELRRMALTDGLPHSAGSWMLARMRAYLRRHRPNVSRLISYSDPSRHHGTIYRADNWTLVSEHHGRTASWQNRPGRTPSTERRHRAKWERRP